MLPCIRRERARLLDEGINSCFAALNALLHGSVWNAQSQFLQAATRTQMNRKNRRGTVAATILIHVAGGKDGSYAPKCLTSLPPAHRLSLAKHILQFSHSVSFRFSSFRVASRLHRLFAALFDKKTTRNWSKCLSLELS